MGYNAGSDRGGKIIHDRMIERIKEYDKTPKKCKGCGYSIEYKKRRNDYCSHSCAASITNLGNKKWGVSPGKCCICEKKAKRNSLTCSDECRKQRHFEEKRLPLFRSGGIHKNRSLKKCLVYLHGNFCTICGCGGRHYGKILVLQIDHIDGNSDNNLPDNLRLLCPNCHSQTDTFCSKGKTHKETKRNSYNRKRKVSTMAT